MVLARSLGRAGPEWTGVLLSPWVAPITRWSAGALLPAIFLSTAYFYDGYAPLGLYAPPPGFRWVRYGPDLLLVNLTTGRVQDVAYGVFL